jgi:hypothetical protein
MVDVEKTRVRVDRRLGRFLEAPAPLKNLYSIHRSDTADSVEFTPLPAPPAVMALLSNTILLPLLPKPVLSRHLASLGRLVTRVPVWRLTYPTGYDKIPQVLEAIIRHQERL